MSKQAKVLASEKQEKAPKKPSDSKKEEEKKLKVRPSPVKLHIHRRESRWKWLLRNRLSGSHSRDWGSRRHQESLPRQTI